MVLGHRFLVIVLTLLLFQKNIRELASSLMPCNDEKHIFAICLYDMDMYVYRKLEDELSVYPKTRTPNCIPKKKLKLCICVWTSMTWLRALESTLPFKIASRNSWETAQLSKMLCDNAPLTVHQFGYNIVSPKFPAALTFLSLLEDPSLFGEYLIFSYDFKNIEHLITLVNSNAASREPLIIFIALMVSPSTNWRAWTMAICQMDSISFMQAATPVVAPTMLDAPSGPNLNFLCVQQ